MRTGVNVLATAALAASIATTWGGPALAQETIKMGALATLAGAFSVLREDPMRRVRLALVVFTYTAGGTKIVLITGPSDPPPRRPLRPPRHLVMPARWPVLRGPLSRSHSHSAQSRV